MESLTKKDQMKPPATRAKPAWEVHAHEKAHRKPRVALQKNRTMQDGKRKEKGQRGELSVQL